MAASNELNWINHLVESIRLPVLVFVSFRKFNLDVLYFSLLFYFIIVIFGSFALTILIDLIIINNK